MMFDELTSAVKALNGLLKEDPSLNLFGENDNIYGGDVSEWVKFANTLRLRMAIRISNVDPTKAKTEAEAAVAAGDMLEDNTDDALRITSYNVCYTKLLRSIMWKRPTTSSSSFPESRSPWRKTPCRRK